MYMLEPFMYFIVCVIYLIIAINELMYCNFHEMYQVFNFDGS